MGLTQLISLLFQQLGIDRPIFFSLLLRVWQTVAGLVTLFLIVYFLSPMQQGVYYTYNSIITLQIFFELGLSYVIIQFASHEFIHLSWKSQGRIKGKLAHKNKFLQFLTQSIYCYALASFLFLIIVMPIGQYFLSLKLSQVSDFTWLWQWRLLVIATALNLLITPLFAVIEGSGRIAEVYQVRLLQSVIGILLGWIAMLFHQGLLAAPLLFLSNFFIGAIWLIRQNRWLLISLRTFIRQQKQRLLNTTRFSWIQEVWPMQWRIAISWISGYFITQIYTPIVFYQYGPVLAGQIGVSLAVSTMLGFIAMIWLNTKIPLLGNLVAAQNWQKLDHLFFKVFKQSLLVITLACSATLLFFYLIKNTHIGHRVLPLTELLFLLLNLFLVQMINSFAVYLRAHKKDPFVWLSVIGAILISLSTVILGHFFATMGIILGTFFINLCFGLPSAIWLWATLRKQWH